MIPRSYLYVPGDAERKLATARRRSADAVIVDLEDSVTPDRKPLARRHVRAILNSPDFTAPAGPAGHQIWVRVNQPELATDIEAVATPGLTGIVVPKAEPASLVETDRLLTAAEARHGLPSGEFEVIALIETARGVLAAPAIAAAQRVVRLGMGEADLIGELGLRPSSDRAELTGLRLQLVVASAAAGIYPPIGPVETDLSNDQRLRTSTQELRALGFGARTALHPRQLPVINDGFTPSTDEVAQARETIAALAEATAQGSGAALTRQGQFVDAAVARSARETLSAYESLMRHNDLARGHASPDAGADEPPM